MARSNSGDKYFKGRGKVWIDGTRYAEVYKAKMEKTNEYEEIDDPNGYGKQQVWMGLSLEGSATMRKTGNEDILQEMKETKEGFEFDMTIKEENTQSGNFETVLYKGCTYEKFPLSDFENKKITEVELSIKARDYEILA